MKSRAAVLWGINQEWKIEEIDIDPPKAGDLFAGRDKGSNRSQRRIKFSNFCQLQGNMIHTRLPVIELHLLSRRQQFIQPAHNVHLISSLGNGLGK